MAGCRRMGHTGGPWGSWGRWAPWEKPLTVGEAWAFSADTGEPVGGLGVQEAGFQDNLIGRCREQSTVTWDRKSLWKAFTRALWEAMRLPCQGVMEQEWAMALTLPWLA